MSDNEVAGAALTSSTHYGYELVRIREHWPNASNKIASGPCRTYSCTRTHKNLDSDHSF